jgi:hypothetical protein
VEGRDEGESRVREKCLGETRVQVLDGLGSPCVCVGGVGGVLTPSGVMGSAVLEDKSEKPTDSPPERASMYGVVLGFIFFMTEKVGRFESASSRFFL